MRYCSRLFAALFVCPTNKPLAQWLEHWSYKPGVESSYLSRGCKVLFLIFLIGAEMIFYFIYLSLDWYAFHSVRSIIFLASNLNLFYLLDQVVTVYCPFFLLASSFVCPHYFEHYISV